MEVFYAIEIEKGQKKIFDHYMKRIKSDTYKNFHKLSHKDHEMRTNQAKSYCSAKIARKINPPDFNTDESMQEIEYEEVKSFYSGSDDEEKNRIFKTRNPQVDLFQPKSNWKKRSIMYETKSMKLYKR